MKPSLLAFFLLLFLAACDDTQNNKKTQPEEPEQTTTANTPNENAAEPKDTQPTDSYTVYTFNPEKEELKTYWKDDQGNIMKNLANLNDYLVQKNITLLFAMNGGMYMEDHSPLGLYIENGKQIKKINRIQNAFGNFFMQPNGVFLVGKNGHTEIVTTQKYKSSDGVLYATQSGPLLLVNGTINSKFTKGSVNVQIRNGVGVTQDYKTIFIISEVPVSLYDFAAKFKALGCDQALFLDGAISATYIKGKRTKDMQINNGVLIGITKK